MDEALDSAIELDSNFLRVLSASRQLQRNETVHTVPQTKQSLSDCIPSDITFSCLDLGLSYERPEPASPNHADRLENMESVTIEEVCKNGLVGRDQSTREGK